MALNKVALQQGIKQLMDDMEERTEPSNLEFSNRLANLIDTYVKTATVNVNPGIALSTTGPYASAGVTTAPGTGTLN